MNYQFLILQAIGIILVVTGHRGGISFFDDWFPMYSFHMPMFVFISGYFYKTYSEQKIKEFFLKKVKHLVFPYFLWNFFYGIISTILIYNHFTFFPDSLNLKSFLIDPWIWAGQFMLNQSAWFVLSLFLVQVLYVVFRKVCSKGIFNNDYLKMILLLCIGVLSVVYANKGYNYSWYLTVVRTLFLLPFYHIGYLYKAKLEIKDCLNNVVYFISLFFIQYLLLRKYGNLSFTAVHCNDFNQDNVLLPYITSITGIMFWLRISKILVPSLQHSKAIYLVGTNTFSIMMHHFLIFFILNFSICFLTELTGSGAFDYEAFRTNGWYIPEDGFFRFFYSLAGIIGPIYINTLLQKIKKFILLHLKIETKKLNLYKG